MSTHIMLFILAIVLVNLITYGGVTAVYLADKRRVDPPRPVTAPVEDELVVRRAVQELQDAA